MINSKQAVTLANHYNKSKDVDQLDTLEKSIKEESLKGKYSINVTERLTDKTICILLEEGFKVETGGRPGEREYLISWEPISEEEVANVVKWIMN